MPRKPPPAASSSRESTLGDALDGAPAVHKSKPPTASKPVRWPAKRTTDVGRDVDCTQPNAGHSPRVVLYVVKVNSWKTDKGEELFIHPSSNE